MSLSARMTLIGCGCCFALSACGDKPEAAAIMPTPVVLPAHYAWLTPAQVLELKQHTPNLGILDVRDEGEMRDGNGWILGAQPLPFFTDYKTPLAKLDPERPWLVYCAIGGRSELVAKAMADRGFKHVSLLKGGFIEWRAQKMEVVR